jgi:hypothetical protein
VIREISRPLLPFSHSRSANLTVNGSVKFAVEKRKLFVIDDGGFS